MNRHFRIGLFVALAGMVGLHVRPCLGCVADGVNDVEGAPGVGRARVEAVRSDVVTVSAAAVVPTAAEATAFESGPSAAPRAVRAAAPVRRDRVAGNRTRPTLRALAHGRSPKARLVATAVR